MPPASRTWSRRISKADRAKLAFLVLETLTFLNKHTTWTTNTVTAVIKSEPSATDIARQLGCTSENMGRRVAAALRRGVKRGVLLKNGNRFRFKDTQKSLKRLRLRRDSSPERRRLQRRSSSSSRS